VTVARVDSMHLRWRAAPFPHADGWPGRQTWEQRGRVLTARPALGDTSRMRQTHYDYTRTLLDGRVIADELPRSKLRGIKPLNPETVVVRTALARQFGGVDHGVSGGGTLCEP